MPIDVEESADGHVLVSFHCTVTIIISNAELYEFP